MNILKVFVTYCHIVLHIYCTNLYSHQQCIKVDFYTKTFNKSRYLDTSNFKSLPILQKNYNCCGNLTVFKYLCEI